MIRRAALITFREDVTDEQAREALEKIADVLDVPYIWNKPNATVGDYVQEYDDRVGGPVWYIP